MDQNAMLNLSRKCSALINRLPSDDFEKLSELVHERYMIICGNQTVAAFTTGTTLSLEDHDELSAKLQNRLNDESLDKNSLTRSFELLLNLYAENIKSNVKTKTLKNILSEAGWQEDKIEIFIDLRKTRALETTELVKNKSFQYSPNVLKNVNRKIKILSDHSCYYQPKLPLAEIDFSFNETVSTLSSSSSSSSVQNLTLNFDHKELLNFYDQLENIQNKIDKLYYK